LDLISRLMRGVKISYFQSSYIHQYHKVSHESNPEMAYTRPPFPQGRISENILLDPLRHKNLQSFRRDTPMCLSRAKMSGVLSGRIKSKRCRQDIEVIIVFEVWSWLVMSCPPGSSPQTQNDL